MERFTQDSFRVITKGIDYDNTYDLATFINTISDKYDVFLASDLEEIQDFMSVELGIESDSDAFDMSIGEINQFVKFMNRLMEEIE